MTGKSITYWQGQWDQQRDFKRDSVAETHLEKAMALLIEYSGVSTHANWGIVNRHRSISGGLWGRFFSGRWNTNHGEAVKETLALFYNYGPTQRQLKEFGLLTIDNLLSVLKNNLGENKPQPEGDLSRILEVIKNNTRTDFKTINKKLFENNCKSSKSGIAVELKHGFAYITATVKNYYHRPRVKNNK